MLCAPLFEAELTRRGIEFVSEEGTSRYEIKHGDREYYISIDNLERAHEADGDEQQIIDFVDAIFEQISGSAEPMTADGLYWTLEPSDYAQAAHFRVALSDRVDRVLTHLSPTGSLISWVGIEDLEGLNLTEEEASRAAYANLDRELGKADLDINVIEGVKLGSLLCGLPFQASLVLAPSFAHVVQFRIGWPLYVVVPARDFVVFWDRSQTQFTSKIGPTVVHEFQESAYPITTEVFELTSAHLKAIGAFTK